MQENRKVAEDPCKKAQGFKKKGRGKTQATKEIGQITNQSKDFAHKLSHKLVNSKYTSFAVEKLRIQNMARNRSIAQSIHNASWGMFINIL